MNTNENGKRKCAEYVENKNIMNIRESKVQGGVHFGASKRMSKNEFPLKSDGHFKKRF